MLRLSVLKKPFAICRLPGDSPIPGWTIWSEFFSATRTPDELSIVCEESCVPEDVKAVRGWRALKVAGPLDFNQTGVLSSISTPLANAGISIFSISTYDTDYVLVRKGDLLQTFSVMNAAGFRVADVEAAP